MIAHDLHVGVGVFPLAGTLDGALALMVAGNAGIPIVVIGVYYTGIGKAIAADPASHLFTADVDAGAFHYLLVAHVEMRAIVAALTALAVLEIMVADQQGVV